MEDGGHRGGLDNHSSSHSSYRRVHRRVCRLPDASVTAIAAIAAIAAIGVRFELFPEVLVFLAQGIGGLRGLGSDRIPVDVVPLRDGGLERLRTQ